MLQSRNWAAAGVTRRLLYCGGAAASASRIAPTEIDGMSNLPPRFQRQISNRVAKVRCNWRLRRPSGTDGLTPHVPTSLTYACYDRSITVVLYSIVDVEPVAPSVCKRPAIRFLKYEEGHQIAGRRRTETTRWHLDLRRICS